MDILIEALSELHFNPFLYSRAELTALAIALPGLFMASALGGRYFTSWVVVARAHSRVYIDYVRAAGLCLGFGLVGALAHVAIVWAF